VVIDKRKKKYLYDWQLDEATADVIFLFVLKANYVHFSNEIKLQVVFFSFQGEESFIVNFSLFFYYPWHPQTCSNLSGLFNKRM